MEKDKKKSTVNANATNSGRAKDKKKDNHAVHFLPMETSDEEAQTTDGVGEFHIPSIYFKMDTFLFQNKLSDNLITFLVTISQCLNISCRVELKL